MRRYAKRYRGHLEVDLFLLASLVLPLVVKVLS